MIVKLCFVNVFLGCKKMEQAALLFSLRLCVQLLLLDVLTLFLATETSGSRNRLLAVAGPPGRSLLWLLDVSDGSALMTSSLSGK